MRSGSRVNHEKKYSFPIDFASIPVDAHLARWHESPKQIMFQIWFLGPSIEENIGSVSLLLNDWSVIK